jgi:hypothetical protein
VDGAKGRDRSRAVGCDSRIETHSATRRTHAQDRLAARIHVAQASGYEDRDRGHAGIQTDMPRRSDEVRLLPHAFVDCRGAVREPGDYTTKGTKVVLGKQRR